MLIPLQQERKHGENVQREYQQDQGEYRMVQEDSSVSRHTTLMQCMVYVQKVLLQATVECGSFTHN